MSYTYPMTRASAPFTRGYNWLHLMQFTLDNRTQIIVQIAVSGILCAAMLIAWRNQKTYRGFGRWTISKIPNGLGWLLISLRGFIPDWASVLVGNFLIFLSPILLYEGIRQFRGKSPRDTFNYVLILGLLGVFAYFFWVKPSVNARLIAITAFTMIILGRSSIDLFLYAPRELRVSYWFTAVLFGLYTLVLALRVLTAGSLPQLANPFQADLWENLLFLATNMVGIGWTFGFFMMTNDRLTLELRKAETGLREMATIDFLTGANNRRLFIDIGQRECLRSSRNGSPSVLLLMDIDDFKKVNDTYGHMVGDEMLRRLAALCRSNLRSVDVFARWGGDEFVIFLPDTDLQGGQIVAETIRRAMADITIPVGIEFAQVTLSIGGSSWHTDDKNLDGLLQRADIALYRAKEHGSNCVVM